MAQVLSVSDLPAYKPNTQALSINDLPAYKPQGQASPSTLLDKVRGQGEAAVQGAAQGLSDVATDAYNVGAAIDRGIGLNAPAGTAPNFEGQAAQSHPITAEIGSIAPMVAMPAFRAAEGAGLLARLGANAATGAGYGALNSFSNPNVSAGDIAQGALTGGAAGAILPEALSAPFKAGKAIAAPIVGMLGRIQSGAERDIAESISDRSATPAEAGQAYQTMQDLGVKNPTLGAVTGNPGASALTEYSTLALFTGQKQSLRQTLAQADNAAQNLFNHLSAGVNHGDIEKKVVSDLQGITQDNNKFSSAAYDSLSNVASKILGGVDKQNAQSFAASKLKDIKSSVKGNKLSDRVDDPTVMDMLTRVSQPYDLGRPATLADLIDDRSEIGKELGNETIPSSQTPALKGMYSAFTKDIEENLNKAVPPDLKEQWANDFASKIQEVINGKLNPETQQLEGGISNPENAAKLQAESLAIRNKILGDNSVTLKDIWKAANDWHKENVGPLQGNDVQYHSFQGLGAGVAKTLLQEQNHDAFKLLPSSTRKLIIASKLRNAVTDIQPGEEGTEQGVVNAARLSRQYKIANNNQNLGNMMDGLSYTTPGGTTIPLKTAFRNLVNLNNSVADLRPVVKKVINGYGLKGLIGGGITAAIGTAAGGLPAAAAGLGALSVGGRAIGNLMRDPRLIKAYANPSERMNYIMSIIPGANKASNVGDLIRRQNMAPAAAYMLNQQSAQ